MNVSLICACKNRYDSLYVSLNSWLKFDQIKEIIIVDWSSDQEIKSLLNIDSRIKIIRVNGEKYFNLSQPLNLAASIATQDYILKFDTDYVLNPYNNFFDNYLIDDSNFVSGIKTVENPHHWSNENNEYRVKYSKSSIEELFQYFCSYSPFFKYLKGMLYVSRKNFNSIGGYDEKIDSYGWEDDNISERLRLYGLNQIYVKNDISIIHLPHSNKKRYENCSEYELQIEENYRNNLLNQWSGEELEWQTEYLVVQDLITRNKLNNKITDYYVNNKNNWNIKEIETNYYIAKKMKRFTVKFSKKNIDMKRLKYFPDVRYISLEESYKRREKIESEFEKYGIKTIPFISKRFSESNDNITGKNVYQLNEGTKGCCISHLKMIKEWYENSDESYTYGFFCEDDLSLETVQYWDFTWEEFLKKIPDDADCVQLCTIRNNFDTFELRERLWDDWGVTAYILTREHAKKIIDTYIKNDVYHLEIPNQDIMPLIENIIFSSVGKTYTIPLFVENINFESTFVGNDDDVNQGQKNNHYIAHEKVMNWWKNTKNQNKKIPKVVDSFSYFNEKELLELRIELLKDYVDKFIIIESNLTHSGNEKEFTCKKTLKELNLYDENKIEVIELVYPPIEEYELNYIDKFYNNNDRYLEEIGYRERVQRDALLNVIEQFSDDTVFFISDCDEIINPLNIEFISNIARNTIPSNINQFIKIPLVYLQARADLRAYRIENDEYSKWDMSMVVTTKQQLKKWTPTEMRAYTTATYVGEGDIRYEDLGWHFSWMGGSERNLLKAHSYSHYAHNFNFTVYGECRGEEMVKFIKSHIPREGSIAISGNKNEVLKKYPINNLPQKIFELPRVKDFLLPEDKNEENIIILEQKSEIENLITRYSLDTENPEHNFSLGMWYEQQGHTAPAVSYFLRCAERASETDKDLSYEALIHASHCYDRQGTRDESSRSLLWQAQVFLPHRPEAYYLLARFAHRKEWWQDCYVNSDFCLRFCDFNVNPLRTDVEYPGKYGILYEKAISAWWWGKAEESRNLLQEILINYELPENDYKLISNKLKEIGGEIPSKNK